ncbi:LysR family transcriptional regulator [Bradyrhizobium manausense]|uniref:LysR family transcriptional regulator n=1 Tax=Bradyrhizobium TaxID=374 RepID=UPI001BA9D351|nr:MULTISPECIES: LysR family transcriptional regulator [Bradyrhizobium]MBR0824428.1 LysR family transcriptional regulator [Bradyrhizobium manausense]UVO26819.1 LysR family transcriptional regulator [Bradyrhizobium arachidis]
MPDIKTLDLNLLKAFNALMEERNVTRAAAQLGLTQPAMSGILRRLRASFDDPLFARTQRGIVPTARALELASPVRQVLGEIEALLQPRAFEPHTASFTLSLTATDYALRAVVVPFLSALRQRAPNIRVAVRPIDEDRMRGQFERGDLDFALLTPETTPPDLHVRRLFDEHYVCAMRSGHPDAKGKTLSLDRFCALDHALVSYAGDSFSGPTDTALARLGRRRRVSLSVASFLVLPEVLRATDLVAVVPRRLLSGLGELVLLKPPLDIPGFSKIAAWHDRTHRDPGHRWIRELLFETSGVKTRREKRA